MSKSAIVRDNQAASFEIRLNGQEVYDLIQLLHFVIVNDSNFGRIETCVFLHSRIAEQYRAQRFGLLGGPETDAE
jgi:hypothetical protein